MPETVQDVPGAASWSLVVPRGRAIRLEALGDNACVSTLLYAAADPLERLNIPDTLKAQMSACIRPPLVLMSDLGRALCSVTGSSLDWHDAITGHSLDRHVTGRFGPSDYATNGRTLGLDRRDLHATVNWFVKVAPDGAGSLAWQEHSTAGDWVTVRAEQDVLVVLATAPHPLDPTPDWAPAGVRVTVGPAEAPGPDDPSRTFRAESARALEAVAR
ncbi:MAG: DUF1989 domain-containing protein [Actinobacteria bacterium]|nr:MAG: DUF1989 domain-containing protein [Actinomycetota bacterium]